MGQDDFFATLFDASAASPSDTDGLARWRAQRATLVKDQAQALGLPLGHAVRVHFATGDPLEGVLEFAEESLFWDHRIRDSVELRIGKSTFSNKDVSGWTRLD